MNLLKFNNGRYQLESGIWITKEELKAYIEKEKQNDRNEKKSEKIKKVK